MQLILIFLLFFIESCSQFSVPYLGKAKKDNLLVDWAEYGPQDYKNHQSALSKMFLEAEGTKTLQLPLKQKEYLNDLMLETIQNNELFFTQIKQPEVVVLKNEQPFHFSLPTPIIFLSSGLIKKYIKHEALLASILSYELVRIEKKIYNKNIIVPVGYVSLDRMLGLNRIETETKIETHKWAYYLMRRAGHDGEYYLQWLQAINRNTADFISMLGDGSIISREEAMFKAFIIRRSKLEDDKVITRKESSKNFYSFIFSIKDKAL
jgi:hypothetical protein